MLDPIELQEKIIEFLDSAVEPVPATKIAEAIGVYRKTASKQLEVLREEGTVIHNGETGRGSGWSLTAEEVHDCGELGCWDEPADEIDVDVTVSYDDNAVEIDEAELYPGDCDCLECDGVWRYGQPSLTVEIDCKCDQADYECVCLGEALDEMWAGVELLDKKQAELDYTVIPRKWWQVYDRARCNKCGKTGKLHDIEVHCQVWAGQ